MCGQTNDNVATTTTLRGLSSLNFVKYLRTSAEMEDSTLYHMSKLVTAFRALGKFAKRICLKIS